MAKIIELYIPGGYQEQGCVGPPQKLGKAIEFCLLVKKSA
jgi:hypothetical protein